MGLRSMPPISGITRRSGRMMGSFMALTSGASGACGLTQDSTTYVHATRATIQDSTVMTDGGHIVVRVVNAARTLRRIAP